MSERSDESAPSSPPLSRRERKAIAVRRGLFAAGLAAFERQPIGLVSVLDITEAADVAKGVFYLHFPSKDAYLLALLEDVQHRFLDAVRAATAVRRTRPARVDAAVRQLLALPAEMPAATRFRMRMASFQPDEVGEPGLLARLREDSVRGLAALLADRDPERLEPSDVRAARLVDALCWAVIGTAAWSEEPLCDADALSRIVASALRLAGGT